MIADSADRTPPRFYPILDLGLLGRRGLDPLEVTQALLDAGAEWLQFRHKGSYDRDAFAAAEGVGGLVRAAGAIYIVNDRADIALMLDADGVHVGQDDLPPSAVRDIVGLDKIVGFSTHNEQQLRAGDGEPVDYLALGPIFGTGSKDNPDPVVGVETLAALRPLTSKPLVAIGGVTRSNAREVYAAGADSVAVISDCFRDDWRASTAAWTGQRGHV